MYTYKLHKSNTTPTSRLRFLILGLKTEMFNQETRSPQLERRAVEESFSWTPQSRKAFLREVPLLSSRAHLGAQKSGLSCGGEGARILVLPSHRQPKSIGGGETSPPDVGAHLWDTEEPPPLPHDGHFEGWGSVGRGLRGGE